MPYILSERRGQLDRAVDNLVSRLESIEFKPGDIVYVIFRLLRSLYRAPSFTDHASIVGLLEAAKLEWYRVEVAPYENQKIVENGDVDASRPTL